MTDCSRLPTPRTNIAYSFIACNPEVINVICGGCGCKREAEALVCGFRECHQDGPYQPTAPCPRISGTGQCKSLHFIGHTVAVMAEQQEQQRIEEEMRIRYFKAVDFSTKVVLKLLESMVRDTFKALGFTSPKDYCVKKLKWSQHEAESLFSSEETINLSDSNAQLEYTLLINLWTELDKEVVEELERLTALVLEVIHNPPMRFSKQLLQEKIQTKLWPCLQKLTDTVRKACHTLLRKKLFSLLEPKIKMSSIFNRMDKLKEDVHLFSLERAVQSFGIMYEVHFKGSKSVLPTPELNASELEYLSREVNSFCGVQKPTTNPIVTLKTLYFDLINRSQLSDVIRKLNILGDKDIDSHSLLSWGQDLNCLQQDLGSRLKVLGRSECVSYRAVYSDPPVDINRWLWTRKTKLEKIDDTFWSFKDFRSSKEVMLEHLLDGSQKPRVVMVYGPPGSGKTCLCEYLQEKWCSGNSTARFIRELQLLVFLKEKSIHHGSFKFHLKNVMFPRLLQLIPESEVLVSLCRFNVCFVMDSSAGCTPEFTSAVCEVVKHLGHNTAFITRRLEEKRDINARLATDEVYLHPLEGHRRMDLCLSYLKGIRDVEGNLTKHSGLGHAVITQNHCNFGCRNSTERSLFTQEDPNMRVDNFIHKLVSEEREDLSYPLPLAYLLWLWLKDPRHLTKVTTMSQLFKKVISLCEQVQDGNNGSALRLFHIIKMEKKGRRNEPMRQLAVFASNVLLRETSQRAEYDLKGLAKKDLANLFPFVEYFSNKLKWRFLHPFLVEILCAWDMKCAFEERKILPYSSQLEKSGSTYVTLIRFLGGFSSDGKDKDNDLANHIVKLFRSVAVAGDDDFLVWLPLLREGSWSLTLREFVRKELKSSKTRWSVPHSNFREVKGVICMVDRRVFLPREVIIETEPPLEVVKMLASHANIDVRIYPRLCPVLRPRDALLHALRGAGNVVEFKGKLEEKGVSDLAHMTRLRTLKLYITSLAALEAFSVSVKKLLVLDDLHLHLYLPFDTPAVRIPRVVVVPRRVTVYLNLYRITDSTYKWAVDVCKGLRCHRDGKTEVYLNKSVLSPDKLQYIKTELHPSAIHISQS
ncbi:uncharacterized protein LOC127008164 [Eriocheir sinensis]|uniref:uncharacterized protein LOC127008164 n=1 Tax=Eriocheir sinensis TaxID=95602 RepID=UPI0021C816E7|nr:uncharacterized protein LOC127008164 [Eriocheir sinensis]